MRRKTSNKDRSVEEQAKAITQSCYDSHKSSETVAAVAEQIDMRAAMQRQTQKTNRPRGGRKIDQDEKGGKEGKDCG